MIVFVLLCLFLRSGSCASYLKPLRAGKACQKLKTYTRSREEWSLRDLARQQRCNGNASWGNTISCHYDSNGKFELSGSTTISGQPNTSSVLRTGLAWSCQA